MQKEKIGTLQLDYKSLSGIVAHSVEYNTIENARDSQSRDALDKAMCTSLSDILSISNT
jgi:hypothetical protein